VADGDATFTIELLDQDHYEIDPDSSSAFIGVVDRDPLPVLQFKNRRVRTTEGVGTVEFVVEHVHESR